MSPVQRPTDPEERKLDRELSRNMWMGVLVRLLAALASALLFLGIGAVVKACAAPLSPSAQFAYNVASNYYGGTGCESVDTEIIPSGAAGLVAESSAPGEPCFIYVSRELAGSNEFPKACGVFISVVATFHGYPGSFHTLPQTCLDHELFLLNHPYYLERRFR